MPDIFPDKTAQTGIYLSSHRGHFMIRDMIELAMSFGFIVDGLIVWTLDTYEVHNGDERYPSEELDAVGNDALEWLNSGQDTCGICNGERQVVVIDGYDRNFNIGEYPASEFAALKKYTPVICKACSGSGRGPRVAGQNFPPVIPAGFAWDWKEGDFGLYEIDEEE